jgi:nucleoside-diphosphate-sugar epimerase
MQEKSFRKIKKNKPVSIIIHSTNLLGTNLAKTLARQDSKVILIDRFDSKGKQSLLELKGEGDVDFIDIKGLGDLMENIGKVDYLFYIQSEFLLSNNTFDSKDFLEESNNLNLCLKVAQKYNAKFSLVTTIAFNEKLMYSMENANYTKPSPYSAEELQKYSETLVAEYHDKSKINARILRMGTILGDENNIQYYETINRLFEDSVRSSSINVQGEGLDLNYLINIKDAVYGILKLTFSQTTNGEVISLCNNNEYTILSIAYKILELNPEAAEIKFVPESDKKPLLFSQYIPAPNAEEYGWKQKINLENSISETLEKKYESYKKEWKKETSGELTYRQKLEEIRGKKMQAEEKKQKVVRTPVGEAFSKALQPFSKKSKQKKEKIKAKTLLIWGTFVVLFSIFFYFFAYPFTSMTISGFSIYNNTKKLIDNYSKMEFGEANRRLISVERNLNNFSKNFERLDWLFTLTKQEDVYSNTVILLYSLQNGSEGAVALHNSIQPLISYLDEFEPALDFQDGNSRTTREYSHLLREIENNSTEINQSIAQITQSTQLLKQVDYDVYPRMFNTPINRIHEYETFVEQHIKPLQGIASFLPDALGVDGRKRYLLLLQNPSELRSTGGWISSYAIIGLEGGQVRELNVDDVYNLDGELINNRRFFEAPPEMRKALGTREWNLSLANWNSDFHDTANNAIFFAKQAEIVPKIDGVIAIDLHFLQNLLRAWGGINVPGEIELITAENMYEKIFAMHEEFSPGESQKTPFLTNLSNEILKKLLSSEISEYSAFLDVILESFESKSILFFLEDSRGQQYFLDRGWTGIVSPRKYKSIPFSVEWNWGANKSNLYVDREERIIANISNTQEIKYAYSLILTNNSSSETYPQGKYENYLRVYIPEDAEVLSIEGFAEEKYDIYYEKGFKVLGGWFNIPIQTTRQLNVEYVITNTENILQTSGNNISMPINIFKQPGTSNQDKVRLDILYPEIWAITHQENFDKIGTRITSEFLLDREKNYEIRWSYR